MLWRRCYVGKPHRRWKMKLGRVLIIGAIIVAAGVSARRSGLLRDLLGERTLRGPWKYGFSGDRHDGPGNL